jgi:ribosomal protein S18 acetylase RimI-like enzyme
MILLLCEFICLISFSIAYVVPASHATVRIPSSLKFSQSVNENGVRHFAHIEKVSTKKRALDVKCFRGFSISPSEYIRKYSDSSKSSMTEDEAIDILMMGYDDNGDVIHHVSRHEREVYFIAVYNNSDTDEETIRLRTFFSNQNGVIGVVRTQIRNREVTNSGNSFNQQTFDFDGEVCTSLPHIYVTNMKVDENMRRRGIASDLLTAVSSYAESQDVGSIILDVDNDNVGAIKLYEKSGYRTICKNNHYSIMIKCISML